MHRTRLFLAAPFLFVLAATCAAQQPQPSPTPFEFETRLETLMYETGALIVKGYTRVGSMSGSRGAANFTAWEVSEVASGRTERGVGVEISDTTPNRPDFEERAYIDYDELTPLLKGIDHIMKLDDKVTKLARFEAQYQTRGGLVLVTFNTPSGYAAAISTSGGGRPRFVSGAVGLRGVDKIFLRVKEEVDKPPQ